MGKEEIHKKLKEIEKLMADESFWTNKEKAKSVVEEYNKLKTLENKKEEYPAVISIISGVGGLDAEDFTKMLAHMYRKYCEGEGFDVYIIDQHETPTGGLKNISLEIANKKAYELLKNETGVHRLVRVSPFNSKNQRHTSFALVDVTPKLPPIKELEIPESDLEVEFMSAGGPGGQNVNKRETAARVKHIPSGISVRVDESRSQLQNREKALEILTGKLFSMMKKQRVEAVRDMSFDKTQGIEWGNQIRSYVLHPYKLVKDLRVDYEESDVDGVLDGNLSGFITALKGL